MTEGTGDHREAVLAALVANLAIAVAKLIGFVFTGAASLLAEAIHSVADTANQGLLIGEAAAGRDVARLRSVFAHDPRVRLLVSLDTQQLGPDELFVGAHVVPRRGAEQ
jgi:divalent metal cation (Fe/Co/Zn/Cd) transporter